MTKDRLLRWWKPLARRIRPQRTDAFKLQGPVPATREGLTLALRQSLGVRLLGGHRSRWLDNGAVFDGLVEEIGRAQSSIHIVIYIWEAGVASQRVSEALVARARAGVACRILVDAFGSSSFEDELAGPLIAAGCEVRVFRRLPGKDKLARNHRKIAVIDGRLAFTGGFGVRDDWLGDGIHDERWRDANVCFSGPAVAEAQQAFAENWQEAGGALLGAAAFPAIDADGPHLAAFVSSTAGVVTRAERLTQLLISAAQRRVWISNAYFVPTRGVVELLCDKARAGMDVRILVPGKKSDSKTSFGLQHLEFGSMKKCGVRLWEYLPSMMHAKTMLVDDELVLVGSINLDPLSLNKLEEAAFVTFDAELAAELERSFAADCSQSRELE
jgi:cardiolipin synthase A/B